MKASFKILVTASALAVAAATGASAARLDFTDASVYAGDAMGTIGSGSNETKWELSAEGGTLNYMTPADGTYAGGSGGESLKRDYDGVGVSGAKADDEITDAPGVDQSILLTFSKSIFLTAVHVLDLFKSADTADGPGGQEHAFVYDPDNLILEIAAVEDLGDNPDNGGYQTEKLLPAVQVSKLRFKAGGTFDNPTDTRDYALAAIDYSFDNPDSAPNPVPLPAGGLLLLGALGGLGLVKRRRKTA
ncbi:VPLPA-CTERM sorting domain-containing protein [Limimaricola litoreus]|uniref:VPLPA-CTERM sorting domain-containing protein n=1 Tax=Limimaricola litoreus TaxID=2955316 RepID=A0A9X2JNG9_9RHOB|nr:VPLPA-CTERM sorting domain-containing protein [Limimaricola litoreus]MCP1168388.1 VPLPA-CTERM sorting domain-containing protein [Limimaricola litoreus]